MARRSTALRVTAALIVPFLLLVGTGSAHAMFRCAHDHVVRDSCCCPSQQAAAERAGDAVIAKACCCTVEVMKPAPPQARAGADRVGLEQLRPVAAPLVITPSFTAWSAATSPLLAPDLHSAVGPPLLLRKHAFLI